VPSPLADQHGVVPIAPATRFAISTCCDRSRYSGFLPQAARPVKDVWSLCRTPSRGYAFFNLDPDFMTKHYNVEALDPDLLRAGLKAGLALLYTGPMV